MRTIGSWTIHQALRIGVKRARFLQSRGWVERMGDWSPEAREEAVLEIMKVGN